MYVIDDKLLNRNLFLKRCNSTLGNSDDYNKYSTIENKTSQQLFIKNKLKYENMFKDNMNNNMNVRIKTKKNQIYINQILYQNSPHNINVLHQDNLEGQMYHCNFKEI